MKSPVVKRSIVIAGHKTSVSLEDAFWKGLKEIAGARQMTLSDLVASIDTDRRHGNLSSAIRLFVLDHYRAQIGDKRPAGGTAREAAGTRAPSVLRADSDAAGGPLRPGTGLMSSGGGKAGANSLFGCGACGFA